MTFLLISFVAGVLTILAPCILPLLPVIVGHSITDTTLSKRRLVIVITSLGLSVILFTLVLKASTLFISIPQDFWKYISGGIIFIFGLITLFPNLWENISVTSLVSQKSNRVLMDGYKKDNVWGDVIVGASLGPIFSACSPTYFVILATVLPASPVLGMLYLFTYTLGLCLALVIVSLLGQKIMNKLNIASDSHGWFKRTLGVIFIIVSIGILTGYDKKLQISILDAGFLDVTKIEQKLLDKNTQAEDQINLEDKEVLSDDAGQGEKVVSSGGVDEKNKDKTNFLSLAQKKAKYTLAPDISSPDGFINTDGKPVTISEFRGKKVVLLDIWTYSCINCQRTIPYLNEWYKKYEDKGLVIVGLHTPEFAFERVQKNIEEAVQNFGIKYPVVLDNDFSTWKAYHNQYWPRKYLIDIDGYIVYDHAGEGNYDKTEVSIQEALKERNARIGVKDDMPSGVANPIDKIEVDAGKVGSPEIYFGADRNSYLANGSVGSFGIQNLELPKDIKSNKLYLSGSWDFSSEYSSNAGDGAVIFKYTAKNVYMVASSKDGGEVDVYIDGIFSKTISIKAEKLYPVISGDDYKEHTLMLKIKKPGINAYTFTFG